MEERDGPSVRAHTVQGKLGQYIFGIFKPRGFKETGTYTAPLAPFSFIYIEEGNTLTASEHNFLTSNALQPTTSNNNEKAFSAGESFKTLVSDPIQCQAPGGGVLSFRPWIGRGIQMSVCAMDLVREGGSDPARNFAMKMANLRK